MTKDDRPVVLDSVPLPIVVATIGMVLVILLSFAWVLLRPDSPI